MSSEQSVTIGFLGAANILPRAMLAPAKLLPTPYEFEFAVAARDPAQAAAFAQKHGIAHVYPDYDTLLASDQVQGVYIPLPNRLHVPWAIKALQAGKAVLLEKPACLQVRDFDKLANVATATGVPITEALMTGFHPWQQTLHELIHSGKYGRLLSTKTHLFTPLKNTPADNYRFFPKLGGGAFFDLGIYWVQFVQRCLGLPIQDMQARAAFDGPNGIDMTFSARLDFADGSHSDFIGSFERPFEANHWLELEGASIRLRNFFRPAFGAQAMWFDVYPKDTDEKEKVSFAPQNYYTNQLETFLRILQGQQQPEPLQAIRERVSILEALYKQAKYE